MDHGTAASHPPPPELRILLRRLKSTPPTQLPATVLSLQKLVRRCKRSLSAPVDSKRREDGTEGPRLAHQLKVNVSALLTDKTPQCRFAAIVLVKVIVDVGGRECLKSSDSWVKGLLALLQVRWLHNSYSWLRLIVGRKGTRSRQSL